MCVCAYLVSEEEREEEVEKEDDDNVDKSLAAVVVSSSLLLLVLLLLFADLVGWFESEIWLNYIFLWKISFEIFVYRFAKSV